MNGAAWVTGSVPAVKPKPAHRDSQFGEQAVELPRSTRTVWRILDRNGRIVRKSRPDHEPV